MINRLIEGSSWMLGSGPTILTVHIIIQTFRVSSEQDPHLIIFLREAQRDLPWACLIFHDVDLLPQNETNTYRCSKVTLCIEQLPFLLLSGTVIIQYTTSWYKLKWPCEVPTLFIYIQHPLLMASRMDKWGWKLPYANYFGGVATMTAEQFKQVRLLPHSKYFILIW